MGSGNSLFNVQLVKYFSGAGRRPCPPFKYITFLRRSTNIKWKTNPFPFLGKNVPRTLLPINGIICGNRILENSRWGTIYMVVYVLPHNALLGADCTMRYTK